MNDLALQYIDLTLPTAEANLALDEALLLSAEAGEIGPILRFWESACPFVVLGAAGIADLSVNLANCRRDGVPVYRRCTGGGDVVLAAGCLVFSLVLPSLGHRLEIRRATTNVLERICSALEPLAPGIAIRGLSDLAIKDRKVSGNSQRWLKTAFLHHGTLLYDFDVQLAEAYLHPPPREPDYRSGRSHGDFLTNLRVDGATMKKNIVAAWKASPADRDLSALVRTESLVEQRYSRDEWTFRR